jgi:hypothetical protein
MRYGSTHEIWSDGDVFEGVVSSLMQSALRCMSQTGSGMYLHMAKCMRQTHEVLLTDCLCLQWRRDEIADGFVGTMAFADGGLYDGKWWGGRQHNDGVYTAPNGDLFDGDSAKIAEFHLRIWRRCGIYPFFGLQTQQSLRKQVSLREVRGVTGRAR